MSDTLDKLERTLERQMSLVQNVIRLIRDVRSRYQIAPREGLDAAVRTSAEQCRLLLEQRHLICEMANLKGLVAEVDYVKPADAAGAVCEGLEVYVPGVLDIEAERERLLKQKEELAAAIARSEGKLSNENFVNRAKPEVVQRERQRLEQLKEQMSPVEKNINELG